jgi:hypothetical protein
MAAGTYTSTIAGSNVEAKELHAGDQTVFGTITTASTTRTQTVGNILRLCHLPKAAVVTDVVLSGGDGECTIDVGCTEDDNIFLAAVSSSAAMKPTSMRAAYIQGVGSAHGAGVVAGLGYTTLTPTYLIVTIDAVSSAGSGGTYRFSVTYHMDNPSG